MDSSEIEIWKDLPDYIGLYQVSNLGRVKSLSRSVNAKNGSKRTIKERVLLPSFNQNYYRVGIWKNKKMKLRAIHQLVAETFLGHKPNGFSGFIVNHIDGDTKNNKLSNLELITQRENASKDRWKQDYTSKKIGVHVHGNGFMTQISYEGKNHYIGYSKCEEKASEMYQKALKRIETGLHPKNN